jgi:hypothetical protein
MLFVPPGRIGASADAMVAGAPVALAPRALAGMPAAGAKPPDPDPDVVGFELDATAVDLAECEGLARRLRRLAFLPRGCPP